MATPDPDPTPDPQTEEHISLRGSFTAVLLMAAFFVACWLGVLDLALERR